MNVKNKQMLKHVLFYLFLLGNIGACAYGSLDNWYKVVAFFLLFLQVHTWISSYFIDKAIIAELRELAELNRLKITQLETTVSILKFGYSLKHRTETHASN